MWLKILCGKDILEIPDSELVLTPLNYPQSTSISVKNTFDGLGLFSRDNIVDANLAIAAGSDSARVDQVGLHPEKTHFLGHLVIRHETL